MDLLLSLSYLRFEILFLLANLAFVALYFAIETCMVVRRFFRFLFPKGRGGALPPQPASEAVATASSEASEDGTQPETAVSEEPEDAEPELAPGAKQELVELVKVVRTKVARGEFSEARTRIVEGLAMDKWNKDLNCLLASLYERDRDYKKAEYVYKDLILVHDTDPEIYMKLGFALSMQGKYEIAFEIYKRLVGISESHVEAIEMLANIAYEMKRYEEAAEYARRFLKDRPRQSDMLSILSLSLVAIGHREGALEAIEKLKNLDPYNPRINEMKEKLELELELAKQFETPAQPE